MKKELFRLLLTIGAVTLFVSSLVYAAGLYARTSDGKDIMSFVPTHVINYAAKHKDPKTVNTETAFALRVQTDADTKMSLGGSSAYIILPADGDEVIPVNFSSATFSVMSSSGTASVPTAPNIRIAVQGAP